MIVQTGNVRKRPFETGRTTGLRSRSTKLILLPIHARTGLFGCKDKQLFRTNKDFLKKFILFHQISSSYIFFPLPVWFHFALTLRSRCPHSIFMEAEWKQTLRKMPPKGT